MKLSIIVAAALLNASSQTVFAAPADSIANPWEGVTFTDMLIIGPHTPGGENFTLKGSPQEVVEQLRAMNPNYDEDWAPYRDNATAANLAKMAKRHTITPPSCTHAYGTPDATRAENNAYYLQTLPSTSVCGVAAGPKVCARISCSYGAGAWLCNDNAWSIQPNCNYLGTYAWTIYDDCTFQSGSGPGARLFCGGQEFDTDNYNVIMGSDNC